MSLISTRVRALRDAFDASFAEVPAVARQRSNVVLAVRVGGDPYALPLAPHFSNVAKSPRIVALPGGAAHQIGIAGIRGALAVVFSLPELLGYGRAGGHGWLAVLSAKREAALAFDAIEGQIDLAEHAVVPATTTGGRRHVAGVVATSPPRALIDIPTILERL